MKELVNLFVSYGVPEKAAAKAIKYRLNLWNANGRVGKCILTKDDFIYFGETVPPTEESLLPMSIA